MSLLKTSSKWFEDHNKQLGLNFCFCSMWNWDRWPGDDEPQKSPEKPRKS